MSVEYLHITLPKIPKFHRTVSADFRVIHPKLCGICAFPPKFHTRNLGKITVFYVVLLPAVTKPEKFTKKMTLLCANTYSKSKIKTLKQHKHVAVHKK